MYNGRIIRQLIAKAGLTDREFSAAMYKGKKADIHHLETSAGLTSTTLERMRDVLHCSMDDFFTKPDWAKEETGDVIGSNNELSSVNIDSNAKEVAHLKELIAEKDRLIGTLSKYIKLLEKAADVQNESVTDR